MAEISDVQILCVVLIIALYFLVFTVIRSNWSHKVSQYKEKLEAEKILAELISNLDKKTEIGTFGREIKLIPDLKEKRISAFNESQIRTLDFVNAAETENKLELREAQ
ncbi:MAG: hypothetical protein K0S44_442 [Bacteroidetes bacterium]|jgi:lipopolysaccharide export LptBFGC system permease protein LptF|nr:hypothetical protein [Bacteroidota bacterium]